VTDAMLAAELRRIARDTRFPDRLEEIYGALGRDPVLIQETLARPVLVERLARSFYAADERVHAPSLEEARAPRGRVARGAAVSPGNASRRAVIEFVRTDAASGAARSPARSSGEPSVRFLDEAHFARRRAGAPATPGDVGPLVDGTDAWTFETL